MTIDVRFCISLSSASCTKRSDSESTTKLNSMNYSEKLSSVSMAR